MSSHYLPPAPRESNQAIIPHAASYPPPPAFFTAYTSSAWQSKPPISQSRPYVSPDPSPTTAGFGILPSDSFPPPTPALQRGERPLLSLFQGSHQGNVPRLVIGNQQQSQQVYFNSTPKVGPTEVDPFYNPAVVAPKRSTPAKKPRAPKKVDGKQESFLTKLYALLEQPEYQYIIRWDETGETIIIESPEELADKILPVVYKQSRFASFSRQLNIYGFNRKLSLRNVERGICDPDASTWSHPFLRRDSPQEDIINFKRRVPPRPSQSRRRASTQTVQDEEMSPTSSERSLEFHSTPDPYQHRLLPDVHEDRPFVFPPRVASSLQVEYVPNFSFPDQISPTTVTNDFSPRGLEHNRRSSIPVSHQPLDISKDLSMALPASFQEVASRKSSMEVPQSAPANTTSIPIPIRVTQQHARTRSVQGEPPSAMLFSPFSPGSSNGISPANIPLPNSKDNGQTIPVHYDNDSSPWAPRRGLADLAGNFDSSYQDNTPRLISHPVSLPDGFAGTGYMFGTHNATQPFSALSDDSPIEPSTISPGIYQSGFSFPTYTKQTVIPAAPAATPPRAFSKPSTIAQTRQERRTSISSSPYCSPRAKPPLLSYGGSMRTIASRRGSEAPLNGLGLQLVGVGDYKHEDQGLPSASVKFVDQHPFERILKGSDGDYGRE
ncbi:hypothetical protein CI109_100611 [Kwoniella shandongensis]|uniref:Uncharacterized protein n=1 Tax=Kwoniella shandongensis TaxID=1734106 RepID=A0A5M6BZ69_9TREE|nr:uncharacterized protein CI109_003467 [Kwoniella shandongensis]KAA5528178.1 hypothetical protein CI109_003467 [Kwoniella shandongensis]